MSDPKVPHWQARGLSSLGIETSDKVARLSEAGHAYEARLRELEHQFESKASELGEEYLAIVLQIHESPERSDAPTANGP